MVSLFTEAFSKPIWIFGFGISFAIYALFCFIFAYKNKEYGVKVTFNVTGVISIVIAIISLAVFFIYSKGYGFIF